MHWAKPKLKEEEIGELDEIGEWTRLASGRDW
jgi:hypothetical protein